MDIGAEFFRWEVATALAGQRLGINPFDQPNVQESKDNTKRLLDEFEKKGKFSETKVIARFGELTLASDATNEAAILEDVDQKDGERAVFVRLLRAHFNRARSGEDYVALTQYFDETDARDTRLQSIRTRLRDALKVATTTGYGPRFLHSTGQLHKGGPDSGVFLQLSANDGEDLNIPGRPYGFATLVAAQALGDFESLSQRNRRAARLHLGNDVNANLDILVDLIKEVLTPA